MSIKIFIMQSTKTSNEERALFLYLIVKNLHLTVLLSLYNPNSNVINELFSSRLDYSRSSCYLLQRILIATQCLKITLRAMVIVALIG